MINNEIFYGFLNKFALSVNFNIKNNNFNNISTDIQSKYLNISNAITHAINNSLLSFYDFPYYIEISEKTKNGIEYKKLPFFLLNQSHTNIPIVINDKNISPERIRNIKADSLITRETNIILAIKTADCIPIILIDKNNKVVSVVHAGWRGAINNIIKNSLEKMKDNGANMKEISAFIGPCIQQNSYEVDYKFYTEVLDINKKNIIFFKLSRKYLENQKDNIDFLKKNQKIIRKENIKYLFDLPGYCKQKLLEYDIKSIALYPIDTYSNPDNFFSYRYFSNHQYNDIKYRRQISWVSITDFIN
ncbi:peptidoglycan editing factor PgeF [Lyticum sinuosum]|uniref:Purine nucleoside phosphorylase n=1 Tax=Lyticum sinuosum TaxID=1332059 RepID=A0AAE4VKL6_9RICK|nr:peptidoglycan editing factor PgeF [Lyticum sinuosum]MDZ5761285.1 Polyphenol oxidase family protein [Lyticum sinuosum]